MAEKKKVRSTDRSSFNLHNDKLLKELEITEAASFPAEDPTPPAPVTQPTELSPAAGDRDWNFTPEELAIARRGADKARAEAARVEAGKLK